jgi:hypothetical protein
MGDGVNVAARLEGICEPGGLCLSEDAWRQVREKLREPLADLGEKRLKNIAHPVRAYALSAAQIEASGITGPTATAPKRARHPCALAGHRRRPRRRRSRGRRLLLAQRRSNEGLLFFRRITVDAFAARLTKGPGGTGISRDGNHSFERGCSR